MQEEVREGAKEALKAITGVHTKDGLRELLKKYGKYKIVEYSEVRY